MIIMVSTLWQVWSRSIGRAFYFQGYEDWLRHKADHEVNHTEAQLVKDGRVAPVQAKDLRVGDIIKVVDGACLPCDVVLLASSNSDGRCHITSVNLDGETSLKVSLFSVLYIVLEVYECKCTCNNFECLASDVLPLWLMFLSNYKV